MNGFVSVELLFRNNKTEVQMTLEDYNNLPIDALRCLGRKNPILIPNDINEDVFQSFISYFENHMLPDITIDNISQFESLNNIMKVPVIAELIHSKHDLFNNCLHKVNKLIDNSFYDKSDVELKISQNLDFYIEKYGEKLMNASIQSLFNILNNAANVKNQNQLYELIMSRYRNNNDSNLLALLPLINGNLLNEQNLKESIESQRFHYGYAPEFDVSSLFDKIYELKQEIGTYHQIFSFIPRDSIKINLNNVTYILDPLNFNAKIVLPDIEEIKIPRSIHFYCKEFLITDIDYSYINKAKSIIIAEDSEMRAIDLSRIRTDNEYQIFVPPSVEKIIFYKYALYDIILSPNNRNFFMLDNKFLLAKSNINDDHFDILIYSKKI